MYPIKSQMRWVYFTVLILIFSPTSFALKGDNLKKLHIIADSVLYNFKTGTDSYEGHVEVDQGSTHITADKLVTKKNSQHKIEEATAYGTTGLAHFWTLPKLDDPEIHAVAKIIKFYPLVSNISLEREVYVTQGKNSFKGELIHYNSSDQTIIVPASTSGRAVIVYDPATRK